MCKFGKSFVLIRQINTCGAHSVHFRFGFKPHESAAHSNLQFPFKDSLLGLSYQALITVAVTLTPSLNDHMVSTMGPVNPWFISLLLFVC